jgi:hypothetical protein
MTCYLSLTSTSRTNGSAMHTVQSQQPLLCSVQAHLWAAIIFATHSTSLHLNIRAFHLYHQRRRHVDHNLHSIRVTDGQTISSSLWVLSWKEWRFVFLMHVSPIHLALFLIHNIWEIIALQISYLKCSAPEVFWTSYISDFGSFPYTQWALMDEITLMFHIHFIHRPEGHFIQCF